MKERAAELEKEKTRGRGNKKAAEELDLLAKLETMDPADRAMAERIHAIVTATAPDLAPKLWYGQPAYASQGKVVCFFRSGHDAGAVLHLRVHPERQPRRRRILADVVRGQHPGHRGGKDHRDAGRQGGELTFPLLPHPKDCKPAGPSPAPGGVRSVSDEPRRASNRRGIVLPANLPPPQQV
ncbi:hypothetical protein GA0061091_11310 [Gordonia sp. v-85]|nr:hypothetical protein GA0061091_11310 [Gordonia sp. v-85]